MTRRRRSPDTAPEDGVEPDGKLRIGDETVAPGRRVQLDLPVARLFTGSMMTLPVVVLHGRRPGPRLWLDAAIHGDELNGLEIIRRILERLDVRELRGAVIAVPVVNVFGLIERRRYLPDRRDLNRSFPGSARGSLAARLAHLFMTEVVASCDYGIDLHTAGTHRTNLPHVRANLEDPETRRLAAAFGAPLMYGAPRIRGTLRDAADRTGAKLLVYEAGEPQRFDQEAIETGVRGVLRVLAALDMWPLEEVAESLDTVVEGTTSRWLRAGRSGIFHLEVALGEWVIKGQVVGTITGPIDGRPKRVRSPMQAMVMGHATNPLVHRGDALVHLVQGPGKEG